MPDDSTFFSPANDPASKDVNLSDVLSLSKDEAKNLIHSSEAGWSEIWLIDKNGRFRALKSLKPSFRGRLCSMRGRKRKAGSSRRCFHFRKRSGEKDRKCFCSCRSSPPIRTHLPLSVSMDRRITGGTASFCPLGSEGVRFGKRSGRFAHFDL